jgi:putative flippase GtrA
VLDLIQRAVAWSRTHQGKKLIRFTSVSLVATATSQAGIIVFYGIFHLWGVVQSTLVANLLATIPSYHLNRKWTWGKTGRSHLMKEILPFWTISIIGITFSFFMSFGAKYVVHKHSYPQVSAAAAWPHWANTLIVMAVNFLAFGIFWVLKLMLFNKIFHVPNELDEVEEHLEHEEEEEAALAFEGEDVS